MQNISKTIKAPPLGGGWVGLLLLWAIIISFYALYLPPPGEIDSSVLILVAQILIFIASVFGIQLPETFRMKK